MSRAPSAAASSSRLARRVTPALTAPASVPGPQAPAAPAPADPAPAAPAPTGSSGQLTDGLVHNDQFDFDDYGLTIDVALGLAAVGGHGRAGWPTSPTRSRRPRRELHARVSTSVPDDVYAGATAKALRLAGVAGADPTRSAASTWSPGSRALASDARRSPVGSRTPAPFGDYANVIGQAFAASGLDAAGSDAGWPTATDFLLEQQCEDGFFRLDFAADATAADQTLRRRHARAPARPTPTPPRSRCSACSPSQADDPTCAAALDDGRGLAARASRRPTAPSAAAPPPRRPTPTAPVSPAGRSGCAGAAPPRPSAPRPGCAASRSPTPQPCTTRGDRSERRDRLRRRRRTATGRTEWASPRPPRTSGAGPPPRPLPALQWAPAAAGGVRRDRADRLRPGRRQGHARGHRARPGRRRVRLHPLGRAGGRRDRRHPARATSRCRPAPTADLHGGLAGRPATPRPVTTCSAGSTSR